jgi:N-acylneuraminate cytidylyltransferase
MIAWSIEAAKSCELFDRIIVTTDDSEIAQLSVRYGAEVPFIRPAQLSNDHATTTAVISHAVEWAIAEGWPISAACCIYATAPLIQVKDIKQGWNVLNSGDWAYTFSATTYGSTIFRSFKRSANGGVEMIFPEHFNTRSQNLEGVMHDAAQFYWGRPSAWIEGMRIFDHHSLPIIIPKWRVQDIDDSEDWQRAEFVARLIDQATILGKDFDADLQK